jgi:hypothetical protein
MGGATDGTYQFVHTSFIPFTVAPATLYSNESFEACANAFSRALPQGSGVPFATSFTRVATELPARFARDSRAHVSRAKAHPLGRLRHGIFGTRSDFDIGATTLTGSIVDPLEW